MPCIHCWRFALCWLAGLFNLYMVFLVGLAETNYPVSLYRTACAFFHRHCNKNYQKLILKRWLHKIIIYHFARPSVILNTAFTHCPLKFITRNKQRGIGYFELEKSRVCTRQVFSFPQMLFFNGWGKIGQINWYPWETTSNKLICYLLAGSCL